MLGGDTIAPLDRGIGTFHGIDDAAWNCTADPPDSLRMACTQHASDVPQRLTARHRVRLKTTRLVAGLTVIREGVKTMEAGGTVSSTIAVLKTRGKSILPPYYRAPAGPT